MCKRSTDFALGGSARSSLSLGPHFVTRLIAPFFLHSKNGWDAANVKYLSSRHITPGQTVTVMGKVPSSPALDSEFDFKLDKEALWLLSNHQLLVTNGDNRAVNLTCL